jgi:hypothetical protein
MRSGATFGVNEESSVEVADLVEFEHEVEFTLDAPLDPQQAVALSSRAVVRGGSTADGGT